jgi:hypothetical protein
MVDNEACKVTTTENEKNCTLFFSTNSQPNSILFYPFDSPHSGLPNTIHNTQILFHCNTYIKINKNQKPAFIIKKKKTVRKIVINSLQQNKSIFHKHLQAIPSLPELCPLHPFHLICLFALFFQERSNNKSCMYFIFLLRRIPQYLKRQQQNISKQQ